ncbi:MAG: hypothetical protein QOI15_398, partial [Pseudonocardiales bacterium]|nr:hypothetical protein [Pseudonocardiales bacterium]
SPKTFVAHWNGIAWHRVASTNRGTASELLGVDATSSANLRAVGDSSRCQSKSCGDNPRTYNLAIRK